MFPADGAMHIVAPDGRMLCSSNRAASGRSYADAPWFSRLAGGEPVTTGDDRDAVAGRPAAVVAAPVRGPAAPSPPRWSRCCPSSRWPRLVDTFGGSVRRQFTLVDAGGRVLSSSIDPAEVGHPFPPITDGATVDDSRGTARLCGTETVPATGWQVWAPASEGRALARPAASCAAWPASWP